MTTTRSTIPTLIATGLVAVVAAALPACAATHNRLTTGPTQTAEAGHDLTLGGKALFPAAASADKAEPMHMAAGRTNKKLRIRTAVPRRTGLARRHRATVKPAGRAANNSQAAIDCSIQSHPDCQPSGNGTTEHFFTVEIGE